jgi:glycosyltransferase involved in cell wall biosynthesis
MRSRHTFRFQDNSSDRSIDLPHLLLVPIRYFPVIADAIYASILALLLPIYIVRSDPDFVIMCSGFAVIGSIPGLLVSKFRKTKFILDIRSVPVETCGFRGALRKFSFNVSVFIAKRLFAGITIITLMMKKEICERFVIQPSKVGVWTSGVAASLFDPTIWGIQGRELKIKLGLSNKFVVLYHGSLSAGRGIIETVEATKILAQRSSNVVLFLLGSGPIVSLLRSSIKREGIENNVIIHDFVEYEEVPKFISMCDVGIIPLADNPYWRFQLPLKLLEDLAMEKVVIATDIPAHRKVVGSEDCCLYLPSIDPEEIAKMMRFAQINKDKLEGWGKSGRKIVLRNYTWEKVAEDFENYFLSVDELMKKQKQFLP